MVEVPRAERRFADCYIEVTEEIDNLLAVSRVAAREVRRPDFQGITERSEAVAAERDRPLVERHGGFKSCCEA